MASVHGSLDAALWKQRGVDLLNAVAQHDPAIVMIDLLPAGCHVEMRDHIMVGRPFLYTFLATTAQAILRVDPSRQLRILAKWKTATVVQLRLEEQGILERREDMRQFTVVVSDSLVAHDDPEWHWRFGTKNIGRHGEAVHTGGAWEIHKEAHVSNAWATVLWLPSLKTEAVPGVYRQDVYLLPIASYVSLDADELAAMQAAKEEVLADRYPAEATDRRKKLADLEVVAGLGDEAEGQTEVLFVDGSRVLVPVSPRSR